MLSQMAGCRFYVLLTIVSVCCIVLANRELVAGQAQSNTGESGHLYEGPGVLPEQILRARGYIVEVHYVVTKDNYVIRVTRGLNPLINNGKGGLPNRLPILFVHGILESYNVWVVNSFDARPKDFSNITLADMSLEEAVSRFAKEPSAKTLPLFAMNDGHEIWIMSRRGFPGSQTQLGNPIHGDNGDMGYLPANGPISAVVGGLTNYGLLRGQIEFSFNEQFWNFSFDEQAAYDLPEVVDYVLEKSGYEQLSVVAHSAGGQVVLMSLTENLELNHKIQNVIFWAQSFAVGRGLNLIPRLIALEPLLDAYVGAFPPTFTTTELQALTTILCTPRILQGTLCEFVGDLAFGNSGGQAPLRAEFLNSVLYPSSSHDLAQLFQAIRGDGYTHKYDRGPLNTAAYGQDDAPPYNLGNVTLKRMSFYDGESDGLVTPADTEATVERLTVPYNLHIIRAPFNHVGYFFNQNNARLAVIPSLREIQLFTAGAVGEIAPSG